MPVVPFIPAIVSIGGSILQGNAQQNAAGQSADATRYATDQQLALAREQMARSDAAFAPWEQAGQRPLNYQNALIYGGTQGATQDWQGYLTANPSVMAAWNALTPAQKTTYNNNPLAYAQNDWQTHHDGQGAGGRTPPTMTGGVTRAQAEAQMRQNPLWQIGDDTYNATNNEAARAYQETRGVNRNEYDLGKDRAKYFLDRSTNLYGTERDRLANFNARDFATRKGYTDKAIGDRSRLNDIYQDQNTNRMASMMGVSGQVGKLNRAANQQANQLNLEFADTARQWRNEDYNPYATNRMNIWSDYYGNVDAAQGRNEDAVYGNDARFFDNTRTNMNNRNNIRQNAITTRAAAHTAGYGDWMGQLYDQTGRAYDATKNRVSGGQSYADAAGRAYGQQGANLANIYGQQGQNQADMWNGIGGAIGDVIGSLSNKKNGWSWG